PADAPMPTMGKLAPPLCSFDSNPVVSASPMLVRTPRAPLAAALDARTFTWGGSERQLDGVGPKRAPAVACAQSPAGHDERFGAHFRVDENAVTARAGSAVVFC